MSLNFRLQTEGDCYRNLGSRQTDKLAPASRQAVVTKRQTVRLAQKSRQTGWRTRADRQVGTKRQTDRLGLIGK
jgi:hypothetical protein